ncbi:CBF-domain-containing protein [Ramaria rubella]|nr:CBF-domain-containing protein [Ramaria rubella]
MGRIKPARSKVTKKLTKKPVHSGDLKSQIQALGGDVEEDYELLKDADSDGLEDAKGTANNPKLAKDITKFVKSLDFGSVRTTAAGEVDAEPSLSTESQERAKREKTKAQDRTPKLKPDTRVVEIAVKVAENTKGGKAKFVVPPTSQWYLAVPALTSTSSLPTPSPEYLSAKLIRAASLLAQDATAYTESSAHTTSSADARFLTRVLTSGTLSDRLSALTLMVQGSPMHNERALDSLKAMASKKGREESLKALRAIVDWWVGGGAPDRKLKYFRDQSLTHPNVTDQHFVLWYFEDWLKKYFFSILQLLEALSVDSLPYVRIQAMNLIFQLLRDKPEQEQNLLRLLVNKLSDSEKSVASKASHHLLQLLQTHPQMKRIIVHEVSSLILKPSVAASSSATTSAPKEQPREGGTHLRYYAVITFNQIVLTPSDKEVAARLIDVYFELFKDLLGEDAPEVEVPEVETRDHTPKQRRGFKGKGNPGQKDRKGKGKAVNMGFQEVPDANSKFVSAILTGVNRALPFAKTENSATFDKHIDTLFRITHTATFSVSLQALMLIHHVSRNRPPVAARFYRALYISLVDPRLATSVKQAMYLNLLFKAIKADSDHARVAAFVKRIIQVLGVHKPEFICGGLYLLGELFGSASSVRDMTEVGRGESQTGAGDKMVSYDPRKRDPQYAHAETSCLWEILPLLHHYHPSVALHAHQLLTHTQVTATADLGLNTLSHFLDRFVYRNPKKPRPKGASAMQPAAHDDGTGMVHAGKAAGTPDMMNSERFLKKSEGDVLADEVFFHKFFSHKHEKEQARAGKADKRKGKKKDEDETDEEVGFDGSDSDPEEAEIWTAMKKSIPELGGSDIDDDADVGGLGSDADGALDLDEQKDDAASHSSNDSELDFIEDDDDDIISDDENPTGLIEYPSGASDDESEGGNGEWQGFSSEQKTRKRGREQDTAGQKKKRRRVTATFANYEDFAAMIENSKEDDI